MFRDDAGSKKQFISLDDEKEEEIVWSYKWNNILCLWAYHPGQRIKGVTHKRYYNAIVKAIKAARK